MNQSLDIISILTKPKYLNKHTYPLLREQGRLKPRIPIKLVNFESGQSIIANALIDTGSDSCIFPSFLSTAIGHKIRDEDKKVRGVKGIESREIDTWVHGFKIELLSADRKTTLRTLDVVGFSVEIDHAYPILGTQMFLEHYKVSIDYKKDIIEIEW